MTYLTLKILSKKILGQNILQGNQKNVERKLGRRIAANDAVGAADDGN